MPMMKATPISEIELAKKSTGQGFDLPSDDVKFVCADPYLLC